jgi:hypothetical protein
VFRLPWLSMVPGGPEVCPDRWKVSSTASTLPSPRSGTQHGLRQVAALSKEAGIGGCERWRRVE